MSTPTGVTTISSLTNSHHLFHGRGFSVFVAATAAATMGFTGIAMAEVPEEPQPPVDISIPQQLNLTGILAVLPDEDQVNGGVYVVTGDGTFVAVTDIDQESVSTGDHFDGTVVVPDEVAEAASSGVEAASADEDVLQRIADAAESEGVPLPVVDSSISERVETDAAPAPHLVDVVWLGSSGTQTPTAKQMEDAIKRSGQYWSTESGGDMPSFTISMSRIVSNPSLLDICNYYDAWDYAAGLFGKKFTDYWVSGRTHLVVLVPGEKCGTGSGQGTIGDGLENGGTVWAALQGDQPSTWNQILTHELGHNFSLGHSNVLQCAEPRSDAPKDWLTAWECRVNIYRDYYDPMSGGINYFNELTNSDNLSTLNVYHKVRLGILEPGVSLANINIDNGTSQTVTLRGATESSGIRGLRIKDPQTGQYLYVEYRTGTGRDSDSFYAKFPSSILPGEIPSLGPGLRVMKAEGGPDGLARNLTSLRRFTSEPHDYNFDVLWYGVNQTFEGHASVPGRPGIKITSQTATPNQTTVKIELDSGKQKFTSAGFTAISGTYYAGQTVTAEASPSQWIPAATSITYQWMRNSEPISGAAGKTYTLTMKDKGQQITVRAIGSRAGYDPMESDAQVFQAGGPNVGRHSGTTRYDTAVAISKATYPNSADVSTVYLATGTNYPDALGAAAAAAKDKAPLILLPKKGDVPTAVIAEMKRLNPSKVVVAGGTGAVPNSIVDQAVSTIPVRPDIQRRAGSTRYETGRLLVSGTFSAPVSTVFVATGRNFPDALSASAAAGSLAGPVILVDGKLNRVDAPTLALVDELSPTSVYIVGGAGAVSAGIEGQLKAKYTVKRLSGSDRYATSQEINNEFFKMTATTPAVAAHYWATGTGFADALAGAAAAGAQGVPLYTVKKTCVPGRVLDHLAKKNTPEVVLLGGTGVLTGDVASLKRC